jgi:hypothetical protein
MDQVNDQVLETKSTTKFALRGGKLKSLGSKVLAGVRQRGQSGPWQRPSSVPAPS